ncbi:MAG TPA: hypothetical protein VG826_23100 [Pirellulales bacterium]|nr:hypothetical protein [Pirellulales bacterium]
MTRIHGYRWLGCIALMLWTASARADVDINRLRVGFAGHYRVGFWTPVEVTLQGGEKPAQVRLALAVPDGDGIRTEIVSEPVDVPAGAETRATVCVKFGRLRSDLTIGVRDGERTLVEKNFSAGTSLPDVEFHEAFPSTQGLLLALGKPIGIEEAVGRSRNTVERINVVDLPDAAQLPDQWLGYEGVDKLVIGPSPLGLDEGLAEGSARLAALDRWLTEGGHLVLALGSDSEHFFSAGSPLCRFLPGSFEGMTVLTRTTSLEMFGGTYGGAPLHWARGERRGLIAAQLNDVKGQIELSEGDFPLVVRRPYTFGGVTFLAADFSRSPLVDWAGRGLAIKRLLGQRTKGETKDQLESSASPGAHLGLVDLSAQLRGTLDRFRGVRLAPFWAVAGLAAIYIALVGPIDFLLLKTLVRKMEWTWLTFPLVVLAFCGTAGWMAQRMKGDHLLVNQIDLVDVDLASRQVRGTTWFNVFSPATSTYDLSLDIQVASEAERPSREIALSWLGLPGEVLGGMEQAVSAPTAVVRSYELAPDRSALRGVPIPVWSTKTFVGRWHSEAGATIEAQLKSGHDDVVEGKIINRLGVPLKECLLVVGRWAWQVDELKPGQAFRIEPGEQRDLLALLKDFKLIQEGDRSTLVQVATPYDQASFSVRSILQQMMFYEAGNGRSYTGLLNRYQSYVDLSRHLDFGQAILWGETDQPAAAVCRDGQPIAGEDDEHATYYRFVIPLK